MGKIGQIYQQNLCSSINPVSCLNWEHVLTLLPFSQNFSHMLFTKGTETLLTIGPILPICDIGVLKHEQESIVECGASGVCASKEEWECIDDEVLLMEMGIGVRLILHTKKEFKLWEPEASVHMVFWCFLLSHTIKDLPSANVVFLISISLFLLHFAVTTRCIFPNHPSQSSALPWQPFSS